MMLYSPYISHNYYDSALLAEECTQNEVLGSAVEGCLITI